VAKAVHGLLPACSAERCRPRPAAGHAAQRRGPGARWGGPL